MEECFDGKLGADDESGCELVRQTSKLLEELFRAHTRHPEFIRAVIWCMRTLIRKAPFNEDSQNAIKSGVTGLAEFFATKSLWIQSQIVSELHKYNLPQLAVMLANASRSARNGSSVPVRLLLQGRTDIGVETDKFLPSYAMASGENSAFNLGLATDGPVRDARKVPLEGVKKVSMSAAHTLFLTHKGEVFGCGAGANFDAGEKNAKLIVSPIRVVFPADALPIVDIAAGPHHSVFITAKMVYVCGSNTSFCLGQPKDGERYTMKAIKLPLPEGVKKVQLEKVFTNAECTIVRSARNMWIAGRTPLSVYETFTAIMECESCYGMIMSNNKVFGLSNKLAVVHYSTAPWIFPVSVVRVDYKNRNLVDIEVTLTNNSGVLSYTFDPRPCRAPIEPCVASVNGVLIELFCHNYHVTSKGLLNQKGEVMTRQSENSQNAHYFCTNLIFDPSASSDIVIMGYPGSSRALEFCSLFRGQVKVVEDRVVDDGFTEAYSTESNLSGLRVLLLLQEIPGAQVVSSFARSPDGKNLIYVTNSSINCRSIQWETSDYAKLNEERELSYLQKIDLDFKIFDVAGECFESPSCIMKARFPNVEFYTRSHNELWIEDLAKEVSSMKCNQVFRDYLVYNENRVMNRGSTTKAMMEKVCHMLGVQCIRHERFYQLGEPINSLKDFIVPRNCILISDEGVEIKFVRELLELQSSYFGVAVNYQSSEEIPRFRLRASETLIEWALLSIINPNYLRTLKTSELVDLLPFLDQYLLYAITADALRVMFERVNEFNAGVVFDLYETVPQLRPLISEYFYNNLHLLAYWRNSGAASDELILDTFACGQEKSNDEAAACDAHLPYILEPPMIEILESYRKAHWSLFRSEDVFNILLGSNNRDKIQEQALSKYLQEHAVEFTDVEEAIELVTTGTPLYPSNSPEPELVTLIRSRLEEREQAKLRRARKKSTGKSTSEGVSCSVSFTKVAVEESTLPLDAEVIGGELPRERLAEEESEVVEERISSLKVEEKHEDEDLPSRERTKSSSARADSIVEEDEIISTAPQKPAWKAPDLQVSPPVTSPILDANATPPTTSKKKSAGRFTPKGTKFRDASDLLAGTQQGTHFAPWAGAATSPQNSYTSVASIILKEEAESSKPTNKEASSVKPDNVRQQRRTTSASVSWSENVLSPSPATSPPAPSLAEIMREEERRQREGTKRLSRPLQFIEDEERAIDELTQLYRENVGDEVVVRVERCANSADTAAQCPVWTNTPHFRA